MREQLATQADYAREIAKLVANMPVERAAQVYDFARFLQTQPAPAVSVAEDDDWLNDSSDQIAAEDVVWDTAYARNRDKLRAMADEALTELDAGKTVSLFDESGELNLP